MQKLIKYTRGKQKVTLQNTSFLDKHYLHGNITLPFFLFSIFFIHKLFFNDSTYSYQIYFNV